jgi:putative transposase
MPFTRTVLDERVKDYQKPEALLGENGLMKQLTKALVERALSGELRHELGYEKYEAQGRKSGNSRNGKYPKTMMGDQGELTIEVPRDRNGECEPTVIKTHQTRFDGFDDNISSLDSRGMTAREIQEHVKEIYGTEVSPALISTVTEAVLEEVRDWQSRPLDQVYPIVYRDALRVKVTESGQVIKKAVYLVIGVNLQGHKEVLG